MVHKVMLLASIVTTVAGSTPVVSKRRCSDASLLTGHVGRIVTPRKHMDSICLKTRASPLNQGLTFGIPAKNYRRAIKLAARDYIIIDNEGYMFEVNESIGSPMGPGLAASRRSGIA